MLPSYDYTRKSDEVVKYLIGFIGKTHIKKVFLMVEPLRSGNPLPPPDLSG